MEELSIAKFHTCARLRDGGLKCWGSNYNGQVGDGTRTHRSSPTLIPGLCGVTSVATGGESTCVSLEPGAVRCWGLGFADTPTGIPRTGKVVRVTMSQGEACGLHADGSVTCWGESEQRRSPWTIAISDVTQVVGSKGNVSRFFARTKDGSVWHWLGDASPARVPMAPVRQLSCGIETCCALFDDGSVACWVPENPMPKPIPGLSDVVQVSAGGARDCAILADRTVRCWGPDRNIGTFGDGTTGPHPDPSPIPGLTDVRQIDPGNFNACAVLEDGTVKCWGSPTSSGGVLGDGTTGTRMTPVDVVM